MTTYKIAHLTSVHFRYDTRIFLKECISLASEGYSVSLVVADGKEYEIKNGIKVFDVGASKGRLDRIKNAPSRILKKAIEIDSDIYHLHDPELIPIGLKLKKMGKKVIFDAHEDIPKQILTKSYLNKPSKVIISNAFSIYEKWSLNKFDAVIAATPYIRDKYLTLGINCIDINNYPILEELNTPTINWEHKKNQVCYVGNISPQRGIKEMVQSMAFLNSETDFALGGEFHNSKYKENIKAEPGWKKIKELGWLDRNQIRNTLNDSIAGLVTLHPTSNYLDSLPVKMFEYMAAGIPVIASDFPFWKEIVEKNNCGVCVDPLSPKAIAHAIDFLVQNPKKAEEMGANARKLVVNKCNWDIEKQKLFTFYKNLIAL